MLSIRFRDLYTYFKRLTPSLYVCMYVRIWQSIDAEISVSTCISN